MTSLIAIVFGIIVVAFLAACVVIGFMAGLFIVAAFLYPFVWLAQVLGIVTQEDS